ncbi:HNH endonuclease [Gordonibacter sp. 28C]|uniref:HNH endonuclease n=1 Tax=Gordonibacter sp. 28C TaxID=2078569 RepID=UPI00131438F9|nr:HNH endonuclease [Gordonibacter sp. 28C]
MAYERSPQARKECLQHYGYECAICGMDFGKEFGEEFSGVIEVHHLEPLNLLKEEREIDPIRDLVPLCPNCHKMVHRKTGKPYTLDQLRNIRKASITSKIMMQYGDPGIGVPALACICSFSLMQMNRGYVAYQIRRLVLSASSLDD